MRELSPDLLPRDHVLVWVPAQTWHCVFCQPEGGEGANTTVNWLGKDAEGPDGRCSRCGAKFRLAAMGEHVPDPLEQIQREAPE